MRKRCCRCSKYKAISSFYGKGPNHPGETDAFCKKCSLLWHKKRHESRKRPRKCGTCRKKFMVSDDHHRFCSTPCQEESAKLKRNKWYKANKERMRFLGREWTKNNPEKRRAQYRKHRFKKKYGLTAEQHKELILSQNSKCAICKMKFTQKRKPCVDHKHGTRGVHRGVLCNNCNFLIGFCKESKAVLKEAIKYLSKWEAL